jgi:perosamine synthetase
MINSSLKRIRQVLSLAQQAFQSYYFGFIQGHAHLGPNDLQQISRLVGVRDDAKVADFERQFARLVGSGEAVAYAAARMGFYELMRLLGIGKGNEVILLGATCAVMVNAVMRTGATPVFSDIDPDTFGSSCQAITARVTSQTRMIVAQHSFGIPCDIEPIAEFAKTKDIFLLEDCALTLGSKVNGVVVGNFGDAALFSTDHSKPLNAFVGGLVYTRSAEFAKLLRLSQAECPDLSVARQKNLWRRFILEAHYCVPRRYGRMGLIDIFSLIRKRLTQAEGDFLADDFGGTHSATYPYPAKLPAFSAAIGLMEIERWEMVSNDRIIILRRLLDALGEFKSSAHLPAAYRNITLRIVPLRLAWSEPGGRNIRASIKHFINISWTWFLEPIIGAKEPLRELGYDTGVCPVFERLGPDMVNLPCNIDRQDADKLVALLEIVYA